MVARSVSLTRSSVSTHNTQSWRRLRHGELFLLAVAEPVLVHDLGVEAAGDVERGVGAARVHEHDLVGEREAFEAGFGSSASALRAMTTAERARGMALL